jgi:predicted nucleic acid binding AN1-type Zn finger protein
MGWLPPFGIGPWLLVLYHILSYYTCGRFNCIMIQSHLLFRSKTHETVSKNYVQFFKIIIKKILLEKCNLSFGFFHKAISIHKYQINVSKSGLFWTTTTLWLKFLNWCNSMQNLVKTEIPKKKEKKCLSFLISYFLYHLYKDGTSNTQESQKSSLLYIVVMWQFQGFSVEFLFYFEHFMSKIKYSNLKKKKKSLHKILFFGILFLFFENFNISGIYIIQCLLFLSLIKFSPNFNL